MSLNRSSAELGAGDGCGNGNVERFACNGVSRVGGDEKLLRDKAADSGRNAIPFVAHDDEAVW